MRSFEGQVEDLKSVALSADGRRALSGGGDPVMQLWDVDSGKGLRQFKGHTETIWGGAFSADDRHAISGSGDGTLRLWRLPDPPPAKAQR